MAVLPINAVIGKFRIEKLVGAGGMGEVYRATNLQTKAPVAVKALTPTGESETALARFRNEAVIQYNLRHPNVAELYEYFSYQNTPCIVMEFVEGRTLNEWIRETDGVEVDKALEIMADICDAVSYMHSKGTIHRDIKSENIRVNARGQAKLLDFGISIGKNTPALTRTGYAIGTAEKMAPEQHQGLRGDARSDVWSLGVLLYEMVTGVPPFSNTSVTGLRQDILAGRYVPVQKRRPSLPKPVVRMITTCLKLKPDERYASAGVMLREVQQLRRRLQQQEWRQFNFKNPLIAVAGLGALIIGLIIYAISLSPGPPVDKAPNAAVDPVLPAGRGAPAAKVAPAPVVPAPEPVDRSPRPGNSSGAPAPLAVPAGQATAVRPVASNRESTTVQVATYDGPAQVTTKEGQVLGSTPYPLTGPVGSTYELLLKRDGFQTRKVDVQINVNKTEYLFGLEKK